MSRIAACHASLFPVWQRKLSDQARGVDEAFSGNEFGNRITVDHKTHGQRVIHAPNVERRGTGGGDKSHTVRTSFSNRCRIGARRRVIRGFFMIKRKSEFQWTGLDAVHIQHEDNIELNRCQRRIGDRKIPMRECPKGKEWRRGRRQRLRARNRSGEVIAALRT